MKHDTRPPQVRAAYALEAIGAITTPVTLETWYGAGEAFLFAYGAIDLRKPAWLTDQGATQLYNVYVYLENQLYVVSGM